MLQSKLDGCCIFVYFWDSVLSGANKDCGDCFCLSLLSSQQPQVSSSDWWEPLENIQVFIGSMIEILAARVHVRSYREIMRCLRPDDG